MSPRLIILEQLLPGGKKVDHNQLFTSGSHLFCFKEYSKYFQSTYSVYFNRYLVVEIISVSHSVNHLLCSQLGFCKLFNLKTFSHRFPWSMTTRTHFLNILKGSHQVWKKDFLWSPYLFFFSPFFEQKKKMILKVIWRVFGEFCRVFGVCLKGVWKNKIEVWNQSEILRNYFTKKSFFRIDGFPFL